MPVCITAGTVAVTLAINSFTLAWTHSIEKVRWEEDYAVEISDKGQVLRLTAARVRGSGAGMEPPAGAKLDAQGVWHYTPKLAPLAVLRITQSRFAAGYEVCKAGGCQALTALVPGLQEGPVELRSCSSGTSSP